MVDEHQSELTKKCVEWLAQSDLGDPAAVAVSAALQELSQPLRIVARLACGVEPESVRNAYRRCLQTHTQLPHKDSSSAVTNAPELVVEQGWMWQELGDAYCSVRTNNPAETAEKLGMAVAQLSAWTEEEKASSRQRWLTVRLDQIAAGCPHVRADFEELRWAS